MIPIESQNSTNVIGESYQTELIQQPVVGMLEAAIVLGQFKGINLLSQVKDILRNKSWYRPHLPHN